MKRNSKIMAKNKNFPVFVEKDEDGFYVVECPFLKLYNPQEISLHTINYSQP
jgi:hypothetical protein